MPTAVSVARQCLTEEAARVLDEAVAVARRRSHAQTTSLHAVAALLAPPSSALRDACGRAWSCACAYSPRLQIKALELSVGVSLDRLPTAKAAAASEAPPPPVSNSLMAAIKRSQANQRRHPDTFHLYQQMQQNQSSASSIWTLKVEMKHFVLSILDDPIVSRVLGDAGFRSYDIKVAILNPPTISRISPASTRYNPLFFCSNFPDSAEISRRPFNFPFSRIENVDENSRRIGEVFLRKSSRNPLLIGACAADAFRNFTECVEKGKDSIFPQELNGLRIICIGDEISELTQSGKAMGLKIKEISEAVEGCSGSGVVVSYGDLKVLVDGEPFEAVKFVVSELSRLVEIHSGKLWLVGAAASDEIYVKFLAKFPNVQKDWDLHLLPITSASPIGSLNARSSLMGSFVPFAGFFPTPSEFENLQSYRTQSITRCNLCNEKYEQEVSALLKGLTTSVADQHPASVSPWLQTGPSSRAIGIVEAKDDNAVLNVKVLGLQKKWNDICQRLHHAPPFETRSKDLVSDKASSALTTTVSTDLGLGTIYVSTEKRLSEPSVQDHNDRLRYFSGSVCSDKTSSLASSNIAQSSCSFVPEVGDVKDFKYLYKSLSETVHWQDEAVYVISQRVSSCRNGQGNILGPNKGNIWLAFLGPDKVGKRKITRMLAEKVFGSKDCLLFVDLSSNNQANCPNSLFESHDLNSRNLNFRGKTVVDYIADELSKKRHSVVLLENVEDSDFLVQNSLSRCLKTGKFPDVHGREISVNNTMFVITSNVSKAEKDSFSYKDSPLFTEESVLAAKSSQMQIVIGSGHGDGFRIENMNIFIASKNESSIAFSRSKRKQIDTSLSNQEFGRGLKRPCNESKVCLDLNLPVEEMEEGDNIDDNSNNEWLDDFLEQTDENVNFNPFDFDTLAKKILNRINRKLLEILGSNTRLEINMEILIQILAAAWLSDRTESVEQWVDDVLSGSFSEARNRLQLEPDRVIRLVACEGVSAELHQALGIRLPHNICVN